MVLIDLDDSWARFTDPAWLDRPSLHEMQVADSLELAYHIAAYKDRKTEVMHELVTRSIAAMVPSDEVSNRELAIILFGEFNQENNRSIRHFRNDERPLKFGKACVYIQRMMYSKKIEPAEAARLMYVVLLYSNAMRVVCDYSRGSVGLDLETFHGNLPGLTITGCVQFAASLEEMLQKSSQLPLIGYPLNRIRQFMDVGAFIHWKESTVKRNPLASIRVLINRAPDFNEYTFDE